MPGKFLRLTGEGPPGDGMRAHPTRWRQVLRPAAEIHPTFS